MPFAAIATVAAFTLPRRDAYSLTGSAWLANQTVGFVFLHYPWAWDCLAWGMVLGMSALLSTLAAVEMMRRLGQVRQPTQIVIVLLTSFATYEAILLGASLLLGGLENFTPIIMGRIFVSNAVAMVGLLVLDRAGIAVGIAPPLYPHLVKVES